MSGRLSRLAAEEAVIVSHAPARAHFAARIARKTVLLALPVLIFLVILLLAWDVRWIPLTIFDGILSPPGKPEFYPSTWLTLGHAVVPLVFLLTNLVNRRFGEDFALDFVLAAWASAALMALAMMYRVDPGLPLAGEVPPLRIAASFFGAMVLAQLLGVFVFDRTRGVDWWKAPLYSALAASLAFTFVFYPAAYLGEDWPWANRMSIDAGVKAALSFVFLLPYLALRPVVRPLGGFGGF